MKDFTGKDVRIGDIVVFSPKTSESCLEYGVVINPLNDNFGMESIVVIVKNSFNIRRVQDFIIVSNIYNNSIIGKEIESLITYSIEYLRNISFPGWKAELKTKLDKLLPIIKNLQPSNKEQCVLLIGNERDIDKIHFLSIEEVERVRDFINDNLQDILIDICEVK